MRFIPVCFIVLQIFFLLLLLWGGCVDVYIPTRPVIYIAVMDDVLASLSNSTVWYFRRDTCVWFFFFWIGTKHSEINEFIMSFRCAVADAIFGRNRWTEVSIVYKAFHPNKTEDETHEIHGQGFLRNITFWCGHHFPLQEKKKFIFSHVVWWPPIPP